jgi:ACT domain-containing protein
MFAMIMMVDISSASVPFDQFADKLEKIGREMNLSIHTMHEDIFNAMHTI